nr:MAG TPA: hypothetical protein [Caudoviricetes sp.]DAU99002.1 MAG TPA: hypothetical protein [Bacteriophage sp.]
MPVQFLLKSTPYDSPPFYYELYHIKKCSKSGECIK